jgi:hypothetical protein
MRDEDFDAMTGAELAQILALPEHGTVLQAALDAAKTSPLDGQAQAIAVLESLGADPNFVLSDVLNNETTTRLEVLSDELMRARFEEN